jgi:hypothetical protein
VFRMAIRKWWNPEKVKAELIAEHKAGIRALAEFVADRARLYCPVDTGALRASITVVSEADGMRHHVIAPLKYSEPVEFGHRKRNGGFQPPNPFLRKAVRDGAREMPRFIGRSRVNQGYHHGRLMGATFE